MNKNHDEDGIPDQSGHREKAAAGSLLASGTLVCNVHSDTSKTLYLNDRPHRDKFKNDCDCYLLCSFPCPPLLSFCC